MAAPRRRYVGVWDDTTPEHVAVTCGWCATAVEMNRVSPSVELSRRDYGHAQQIIRVGAAFVCPRDQCHHPSLIFFEFFEHLGDRWGVEVIGRLPRGAAQPMDGLPDAIADVRQEAWSSYYGGDYRASVVMGRAAVQRAVRTLGGQGRDLYNEIDDLRDQGVVTEELKAWAHEVRLAAREAAHPEDVGDVSQEEARESLKFMDAFLEFAVALPERRRRAREQAD